MKTTVEIPDTLLRKAKATAASRGLSMREFFTEALREKLSAPQNKAQEKPWMAFAGCLKDHSEELRKVDQAVEEAFETIDRETWK